MLQLIPHCDERCPFTSWGCHNLGFKVQLKAAVVDGDAKPKHVVELGASSSLAGSHRFEGGQAIPKGGTARCKVGLGEDSSCQPSGGGGALVSCV